MAAWSPDYASELYRRRMNAIKAIEKPHLQLAWWNYYASRPIEWIEDWCFTFDPRRNDLRTLPFMLFPKQREFIKFLEYCRINKRNGLVEKCRDAGMTWLCICYAIWLWIFHGGASVGFGSRKQDLVDKIGDPDSILEKGRIIIKYLPYWMLPKGFVPSKHLNYLKLVNPENGATIKGEGGDNIGRGGRSTMYFKDESAHYEHPDLIEAALGDNTDVQIDISSVNGSANVFYRRRQSGIVWQEGTDIPPGMVAVFIFDWRDDPRKTQEWHDMRRARAEREGLLHIFMQEVERDYSGSVQGIIIKPEWARALLDADKVIAERKFAHIVDIEQRERLKQEYIASWRRGERIAAQDIADNEPGSGGDKNAYLSRHGSAVKRIDSWGGEAGDAAHTAVPYAVEDGVHELYYDCIGVGAGFKVEINNMMQKDSWHEGLRVMPWDASNAPLNPTDNVIVGDEQSPKNEDVYENLKAQAWFLMRSRAWKTYQAVTRGTEFPVDEMACIPSNLPGAHQLVMELSQPVKKTSLKSGKTVVDKKPAGAVSPNIADSCVMCYCPTREVSIFDVL